MWALLFPNALVPCEKRLLHPADMESHSRMRRGGHARGVCWLMQGPLFPREALHRLPGDWYQRRVCRLCDIPDSTVAKDLQVLSRGKFIRMVRFVLGSFFGKMNHSNELEWFVLSSVRFYSGKNEPRTKCSIPLRSWFIFQKMNSKWTILMNLKQTNLVQFSFQVWFILIFQKWT